MGNLLPTLELFLLFLAADLVLKVSPGPDFALVVARGVTQGFRTAAACALGVGAAGALQVPAVMLGLAALLDTSQALYDAVRWLGAAYLVYLGVRALQRCFGKAKEPVTDIAAAYVSRDAFVQGFMTNLLNPKVFVFMVAFLPQFARPQNGPVWAQMLLLGLVMKFNGVAYLTLCAFLAGRARRWIAGNPVFLRIQDGVLGTTMIALAAWVLLAERPTRAG